MEAWSNNKNNELEDFKAKLRADLESQKHIAFEAKYIEMQKHIDTLTTINKNLESKLASHDYQQPDQLKNTDSCAENSSAGKNHIINLNKSEISKRQIDGFVEKLLSDKNVNVKYLPDFVERQLYRNVFTILLGLVENIVDSTEIHTMGHRIVMHVAPDLTLSSTSKSVEDSKISTDTLSLSVMRESEKTSISIPDTIPEEETDEISDHESDEKSFDSDDMLTLF